MSRVITVREWTVENLENDDEEFGLLDRRGLITGYICRSQHRAGGGDLKWFDAPRYRLPYDYFLKKERTMAQESATAREGLGLSQSFEEILQQRLGALESEFEHYEDVLRQAATAKEQQEQILAEMERMHRALDAYQSTERPAQQPADDVSAYVTPPPPPPIEDTEPTTAVETPATQVTQDKEAWRSNYKKRHNLTAEEIFDRDNLQRIIMIMALEAPHPGEITAPEVAVTVGPDFRGSGPKKAALTYALYELADLGRLEKTDEKVWPTPNRERPEYGGARATLYRIPKQHNVSEGT